METSLFYDLYRIITSPSQFKISETEFLFFLLGGYKDEDLYDYNDIEKFLLKHKSEATIPLSSLSKRKFLKSKQLCSKLTLDDLIQIQFSKGSKPFISTKTTILECKDKILGLFQKYSIAIKHTEYTNIEKSLIHLFSLCVTGHAPWLFASYKNQKLKPKTIDSTLGRNEYALILQEKLGQYHKIIISGQYGTGKTHFIKYCLSKWALTDYCYITYETDLKSTLRRIRYRDIHGHEYRDAADYSLFNEKYSSALLVIDNMYFSRNFSSELEHLSTMAVNIIVITTRNIPEQIFHGFYLYDLPSLHDDTLYDIFAYDSGITLYENEIKKQLSSVTLNNVLMVSLIAFQCRKLSASSSSAGTDKDTAIVKLVLSKLESLNAHMNIEFTSKYIFKHRYDAASLDLIRHIKSIYNMVLKNSGLEKDKTEKLARETMKQLCLFGWAQIPLRFIEHIFPSCNKESFHMLSEMGLVTLSDEFIQLSPLISHAVFAAEKFSRTDYEIVLQHLIKFLREYDQTLDTPYLSDSLFRFFISFYDEIPEENNVGQKKTAQQFEYWQELSYLITNYYNQNGAPELAQKVTALIKYPDSLKNRHNALDKKILIDLSIKMQTESESDKMPYHIDNYISMLDDLLQTYNSSNENRKLINLYQFAKINPTSLILNALDTALNFLCLLFTDDSHFEYKKSENCLSVLRIFLHENSNTISYFSFEQLLFYRSCYLLIIDSLKLNPESFQQYVCIISSINNKNYSLYGLAFVIFWESFYSYKTADKDIFISSVIPQIVQLNEMISTCKIIPSQTFHLCLSAYIKASMVQYTFISHNILEKSDSCDFFNLNTLRNLFIHCNLTKKNLDELVAKTDSILTIISD